MANTLEDAEALYRELTKSLSTIGTRFHKSDPWDSVTTQELWRDLGQLNDKMQDGVNSMEPVIEKDQRLITKFYFLATLIDRLAARLELRQQGLDADLPKTVPIPQGRN